MTPIDLTAARLKLGLKPGELATALRTPKRTVQDWEAGRRRIPGICEIACELLLQKDRWLMAKILAPMQRPASECGAALPKEQS